MTVQVTASDPDPSCGCSPSSRCVFYDAVACATLLQAVPFTLILLPGAHVVTSQASSLLSALPVSSILIVAASSYASSASAARHDPTHGGDSSKSVLVGNLRIDVGTPRLTLRHLEVRGSLIVNGSAPPSPLHEVDSCVFNGTSLPRAVPQSEAPLGGAVQHHSGSLLINRTRIFNFSATDGGAITLTSPLTVATVEDSIIVNNEAANRGGAVFVQGGTLTLRGVQMQGNAAGERGGGMYVAGGAVHLTDGTQLLHNRVRRRTCRGGPCGKTYALGADGHIFYGLPAPPGAYMLQTSDCRRETLDADPDFARFYCPAQYRDQHGKVLPPLEDRIVARMSEISYDGELPFGCAAGLVGYPVVDDQRASTCSGSCPEGHECPFMTSKPIPCRPGTYCPAGSTKANLCPGGTYSGVARLTSENGCHRVGPGYYAPKGSTAPVACPVAGYRCPGARDKKLEAGSDDGSTPIKLSSGAVRSVVTEETDIEERFLTLSLGVTGGAVPTPAQPASSPDATAAGGDGAANASVVAGANSTATEPLFVSLTKQLMAAHLQVPPDLVEIDVLNSSGTAANASNGGAANVSSSSSNSSTVRRLSESDAAEGTSAVALAVRFKAVPPVVELGPLEEKLSAIDDSSLATVLMGDETLGSMLTSIQREEGLGARTVKYLRESETEGDCPVGHWCTDGKVIPCGEGYFSGVSGQSAREACKECPPFSSSLQGSVSALDCTCVSGYYDARASSGELADCRICFSGTRCSERNTTVAKLPLKIGYYRLTPSSIDVHMCADATVNCTLGPDGTHGLCEVGSSGCRGGTWDPATTGAEAFRDAQCAEGLAGPFCEQCAPTDDGAQRFYVRASKQKHAHCALCEVTQLVSLDTVISGVSCIALLLVAMYTMRRVTRRAPAALKMKLRRWAVVVGLKAKLKMVYGFFMIVGKLDTVFKVRLPAGIQAILDMFKVTTSLGVDVFTGPSLQCLGFGGYLDALRFWMLLPAALVAIVLLVHGVQMLSERYRREKQARADAVAEAEAAAAAALMGMTASDETEHVDAEQPRDARLAQYRDEMLSLGSLSLDVELSDVELEKMRTLFVRFDADGNGMLDFGEFESMMVSVGEEIGRTYEPAQLHAMFDRGDTDRSRLIDFRELVLMQKAWSKAAATLAEKAASKTKKKEAAKKSACLTDWLLRALPNIVTIFFLTYPQVTHRAFESFSCYNFTVEPASPAAPGVYEYFLRVDTSVACEDLNTNPTNVDAWIAIGLYPIGVLVFTACLLFKARHAIKEGDKQAPLFRALTFLHTDLKPECDAEPHVRAVHRSQCVRCTAQHRRRWAAARAQVLLLGADGDDPPPRAARLHVDHRAGQRVAAHDRRHLLPHLQRHPAASQSVQGAHERLHGRVRLRVPHDGPSVLPRLQVQQSD